MAARTIPKEFRGIIFYFPFVLLLGMLIIRAYSWWTYVALVREDGLCEYLQFVLFLVSGLFSFSISRLSFRNSWIFPGVIYFIAAFTLLIVALEEISWGQRLFGFEVPVYFLEHNTQREISFHNLEGLRRLRHGSYIVIGGMGALLDLLIPKRLTDRNGGIRELLIPGKELAFFFLPAALIYFYFEYCFGWVLSQHKLWLFSWQDQETAELLLALGIFIFVLLNRLNFKRPELGNSLRADESISTSTPGVKIFLHSSLTLSLLALIIFMIKLPSGRSHPPFDFESLNMTGWAFYGDSYGERIILDAEDAQLPQGQVSNISGRKFISSYLDGEPENIYLRSPIFKIDKPFMSFRIGGGRNPTVCEVVLEVRGRWVRRSTGHNSNQLRIVRWDISELEGRLGSIIIRDDSRKMDGFILADDFRLVN
jgi:hypothetical protein